MNLDRNILERTIGRLQARFFRRRGNIGFTLIELLVVIAIVAIFAALMMPALRAGKEQTQGIQCLSQRKQFSYAWNLSAPGRAQMVLTFTLPGVTVQTLISRVGIVVPIRTSGWERLNNEAETGNREIPTEHRHRKDTAQFPNRWSAVYPVSVESFFDA